MMNDDDALISGGFWTMSGDVWGISGGYLGDVWLMSDGINSSLFSTNDDKD